MNRPDILAPVAYAVAGIAALSCAFAPGGHRWFRAWCVALGAAAVVLSGAAAFTDERFLPDRWRLVPLAVPALTLIGTVVGVIRRRRASDARGTLPEIEEDPDGPEPYPTDPPLGELAVPHDPWKALYASLALQRAKWEGASKGAARGRSGARAGLATVSPSSGPARNTADAHRHSGRYGGRHRRTPQRDTPVQAPSIAHVGGPPSAG